MLDEEMVDPRTRTWHSCLELPETFECLSIFWADPLGLLSDNWAGIEGTFAASWSWRGARCSACCRRCCRLRSSPHWELTAFHLEFRWAAWRLQFLCALGWSRCWTGSLSKLLQPQNIFLVWLPVNYKISHSGLVRLTLFSLFVIYFSPREGVIIDHDLIVIIPLGRYISRNITELF